MGKSFNNGLALKSIAILGSTGSIGTQALEVIRQNPDRFRAFLLTANSNALLLIKQALEFNPEYVVITDQSKLDEVKSALRSTKIKVL
jgi:1-deoxy-D-xylulose-5-phosphate reductoisomerase